MGTRITSVVMVVLLSLSTRKEGFWCFRNLWRFFKFFNRESARVLWLRLTVRRDEPQAIRPGLRRTNGQVTRTRVVVLLYFVRGYQESIQLSGAYATRQTS